MKFVAAYLLATLGGNPSPTRDDVRGILDSVGAEVEEHKLEMLFREVESKDVAELIAAGREKFAFAPCGTTDAAPAAATSAAEEEKKAEEQAEEKVEDEEEDDVNMLGLFD